MVSGLTFCRKERQCLGETERAALEDQARAFLAAHAMLLQYGHFWGCTVFERIKKPRNRELLRGL